MAYIGKDIIHYGCGLELNPEKAMEKISHAARKNIKKGEEQALEIKKVKGSAEDLAQLNSIWYQPEDPNFPKELQKEDLMYLAYDKGELAGGMILIAVGHHYFLNNLAANELGKKRQAQSLLLWHAVNDLNESNFRYIDVGVSYRPNLYRFFKSWATFKYPVLFNPPPLLPQIKFKPLANLDDIEQDELDEEEVQEFCLSRPYTIVPNVEFAQEICQKKSIKYSNPSLPIKDSDEVQVIDLPAMLPTMYGALIVGVEINEQELWNDFGCFDFVKTEHVKMLLSHQGNHTKQVREDRYNVFETFKSFFKNDDVDLQGSDENCQSLVISGNFIDKLAAVCEKFGIESHWGGQQLKLPCHQNLSYLDIEYIYAVYRGVLNLCSEWAPTNVKGQLKAD